MKETSRQRRIMIRRSNNRINNKIRKMNSNRNSHSPTKRRIQTKKKESLSSMAPLKFSCR